MSKFRRARRGWITSDIRYACYLVHNWSFQTGNTYWIRCVRSTPALWRVEIAPAHEVARMSMQLAYEIARRFP